MADNSSGPPGQGPNKKKPLPFLKALSKLDQYQGTEEGEDDDGDDYDEKNKEKKKKRGVNDDDDDDDNDDYLAMFSRSKRFFPIILQEEEERRKAALKVNEEGADEDEEQQPQQQQQQQQQEEEEVEEEEEEEEEEDPIASTSRSAKRRRLSSPGGPERPAFEESYHDLYGPATPPQRISPDSTDSSPGNYFNRSMYLPRTRDEPAAPSSSKAKGKEKEHETAKNARSKALLTPSGSNSHRVPADNAIVLSDQDNPFVEDIAEESNTSPAKDKTGKSTPIVLDDSDDDLSEPAPAPAQDDDEFDFFVRRAALREENARIAAEALMGLEGDGFDTPATVNAGPRPTSRRAIIPVKIFVVSRLGYIEVRDVFGSKRGLHQDLGLVRRTYVQWAQRVSRPGISEDTAKGIFLTWKGRRIYDSASGASLGWMPDSDGNFSSTAHLPGFTRGGILLEAWTEESYAQYTEEQDRQKLIDRGELADDSSAADDAGQAAAQQEATKVRLFLKERDREPLRLTAWMDTEARTLAGAYRKQRNIPADREIRLRNDGEWLEPHTTIEEADIEDMMTIEVYLK